MATAIKTSPSSRSTGTVASPAVISLVGVLYLLGCLGIVFKLVPWLWWSVWDGAGLQRFTFVGGSLLAIVALAAGVGLLVLGGKLLGPNPPVGVRSGVFVAFFGFIAVLLLTRWASVWLEHWTYDKNWFKPEVGTIISGVIGLLLLAGGIRLFTRPPAQKFILLVEHAGWFHATAYKSNQGQKVRRGTIFGILLLVGAGIYSLISHGTLRRGDANLNINIPFTGKMAITDDGDTEQFIKKLPASAKDLIEIRWPGESSFRPKEIVSFKTYEAVCSELLEAYRFKPGDVEKLNAVKTEPVEYLKAINLLIHDQMKESLRLRVFKEDATRRLKDIDQRTPWGDLSEYIEAFEKEAKVAKKEDELGLAFKLPTGVLVIDRYTMRGVNEERKQHVKIRQAGDAADYVEIVSPGVSSYTAGQVVLANDFKKELAKLQSSGSQDLPKATPFTEDQIVSRPAFDSVVAILEKEKTEKKRDRELPTEAPLAPASGKVEFATLTLLPSVQFTLPLLLLAMSLWLAWRIVNMPTFADFLIATEAEMNKVSWTTQKRLVQDTTVVLITVALMAGFLFSMDWTWKVVLSWKHIRVLYIPPEQANPVQKTDEKQW